MIAIVIVIVIVIIETCSREGKMIVTVIVMIEIAR